MRIALVTYALEIGGVETFLKLLADYFSERGHHVDIMETQSKGKWSETFSEGGYHVIQILPNKFRSLVHHAKQIGIMLKEYDLVILNDAPYAQSSLGFLPEMTVAIPVLHMCLTSMVCNAAANTDNWDAISAVCPAASNSLIHYGIDRDRVVCIPNGIKVPEKWPKDGFDFNAFKTLHMVYIGAINHSQKGVFHLPAIVERISEKGCKFFFDIIGDGPDLSILKRDLSMFVNEGKVIFHGPQPNYVVKEILSNATVLIMPSHFEGLPVVLLESISLGVVTVVSRLDGCTDFVVEHGENGLLVSPGDEKGFAEALLSLANSKIQIGEMSKSAWETVQKKFSYIQTGESYLKLADICRQRRQDGKSWQRLSRIDKKLLGNFPRMPLFLVRPVRKILRLLGLMPKLKQAPLLYQFSEEGK